MAETQSDIYKLTLPQLNDLRANCETFLWKELGIEGVSQTSLSIPSLGLRGKNQEDLKNKLQTLVLRLTTKETLDDAYSEVLKAISEKLAEGVRAPAETTVPTKEAIARGQQILEEQAKAASASRATARVAVQKLVTAKTSKQVFLSLPSKINVPSLTPEDAQALTRLVQKDIKANPLYQDSLARAIIKANIKPGMNSEQIRILGDQARIISTNFKDKLLGLEVKGESIPDSLVLSYIQNPIHAAASLADPRNPLIGEELARASQTIALSMENDHIVARNLLSSVGAANSTVLKLLYPTAEEITFFRVSGIQTKNSVIAIDRDAFVKEGAELENSNNNFLASIRDGAWKNIRSQTSQVLNRTFANTAWYSRARALVDRFIPGFLRPLIPVFGTPTTTSPGLAALWSKQGIRLLTSNTPSMLSSAFGQNIFITPVFNLRFGTFAISRTILYGAEGLTGQMIGINIGRFGITFIQSGEKGLQVLINLGTKAIVPAAGGIAEAGGLAAVVQLAGGPIGIITGIVTAIITFVATNWPKIKKWLSDHWQIFAFGGVSLVFGGVITSSVYLITTGVVFSVIGFASASSAALGLAGIARGGRIFFGTLGRSLAQIVITPILVILIITPIVISLILFIINSGAYVTPPQATAAGFENPYIGIEKTPDPGGPFRNDTTVTVKYTITVTAKKGQLTNITFSDECKTIKSGALPPCPSTEGKIPTAPQTIQPSKPFSFDYSLTYPSGEYNDTAVINTFTVLADAEEKSSISASGNAAIVIGNPPTECPTNAWPLANDIGIENVTQGSLTPFGWTHHNTENAIDIGINGITVVATHTGVVKVGQSSCGGKYVEIASSCNGASFYSYYGHLGAISVATGQHITVGQTIGISDNSGSCTSGPHLHFQFFDTVKDTPKTQKPFLKRDVPLGCTNQASSPCNP